MEAWLRPMLCGTADAPRTGVRWVIEPKLDGWRAVALVESGVRMWCGRNGSNYTGQLPYVESDLIDLLPPDSAVDGELVGQRGWGDVQSVMTRGGGPHTPSRALPALLYVVFDVTRWAGEDLRSKPWSERREVLDSIGGGLLDGLSVSVAPYAPASAAAHEQMLKLGLEGSVCKRTDARYVNSRSNLWV
jgi:ATP-dependent DNA ligase